MPISVSRPVRQGISEAGVLRFPPALNAESFLARHWQKRALLIPAAIDASQPSLTPDELGWLATLDDVESRIVFTDRSGPSLYYRAETGPFEEDFLKQLPERDWTLLVHDVEKHLPELRALFSCIPFVPDWRIDDLMVSFAAPGGGVGPHLDNYDVFLIQGTGKRDWVISADAAIAAPEASDTLALLREFDGDRYACGNGDVLYLPPGVAHWGTAIDACTTYSIGMRAPQRSDFVTVLPDQESDDPFYRDPDLDVAEAAPGYISDAAFRRAEAVAGGALESTALGRVVTGTKDWLRPDKATPDEAAEALQHLAAGGSIALHGMARIAWDDAHVYANGDALRLAPELRDMVAELCAKRVLTGPLEQAANNRELVSWLAQAGALEPPEPP